VIVLRKISGQKWPLWREALNSIKKRAQRTGKNALVYLQPKYWWLYLVCFGLGLYWFGLNRGGQPFNFTIFTKKAPETQTSIITLQQEVRRLKRDLLRLNDQAKQEKEFSPDQFGKPAPGKVIRSYEWVFSDNIWRLHSGVDIGLPVGSNVMAAADGSVVGCNDTDKGRMVTITHGNGWESVYSNLAKALVEPGEPVRKGQVVGISGMIRDLPVEQPGFHFGIYHDKEPVEPEKLVPGLK
jgi:murein DD-endopeptidase MepM/ murein hydrolase activator NlpD